MQISAQVTENQNLDPPQNQEGETHGKELSLNSPLGTEHPQQLISPVLSVPQQAQDVSPNPTEKNVQQSHLSPKAITPVAEVPANEAQSLEVRASEVRSSTTPSQGLPQHPPPPGPRIPQPEQDEESGEAKADPTDPPLSEPEQGPGPTSFGPQLTQDAEPEPARAAPNSSPPDSGKSLAEPPLQGQIPKAEGVRVSTPYPEVPPQNTSTTMEQGPAKGPPATLLPRSRLAPTRLPQPRTLAPLQSRRPTPRLLSPSREEALGTSSDQTATSSPRHSATLEEDATKLPPISPPQPKLPPNLSSQAPYHPEQAQEGNMSEVRLPLISPSGQEQAQQHTPSASREDEAQKIRLPHIPTPLDEPQLLHHDSKLVQEKTPKGAHCPSKKTTDMQASPHNREPGQQMGARKKQLLLQRETANRPTYLKKATLRSHGKPAAARVPDGPNPSPALSLQGSQKRQECTLEIPEPLHTRPAPNSPQLQEKEREKKSRFRKTAHTHRLHNDPAQNRAMSKREPSLKRERLHQQNNVNLSSHQPSQESQTAPETTLQTENSLAKSPPHSSTPVEHPGREEQDHKTGGSQKGDTASEAPEQESVAPAQQPVEKAQAPKDTSQIRESLVQKGNTRTARQPAQAKQIQPRRHKSPAAVPDQVSAEEQDNREGRLRARGSQSSQV